jgi:hypothetical protein
MPYQSWESLLNAGAPWQTTAGTVLNTATTATISPQAAGSKDYTLPANWWYPGAVIKVTARGILSSGGTGSNLTVLLAAGVAPVTLSTGPAIALGTGTVTNMPWRLTANIQCTAIGSTGNTLTTQGELMFETSITPAFGTSNVTIAPLPSTAAALDTTVAMALNLRATLSAAFGAITCQQFLLESQD